MKIKFLYSGAFILILSFLFFTGFVVNEDRTEENKKRINFSHQLHAEMTDCASCHSNVEESKSLTDNLLPEGHESCESCHDVEDDENCAMCHVDETYEPLVRSAASSLIFSHKYHLEEYELECTECHKGLDEVDYSYESKNVNPPMMQCYQCHDNQKIATNECEACHISTADLLPQDHKQVSFLQNHKFKVDSKDAQCAMCHGDSFCQACHAATTGLDEANLSDDFYTPYQPHNYIDNAKEQKIMRVHDFNYRYTHGIDANTNSSSCLSCHNRETFCNECHQVEGGDFALEGMVPESHQDPNFTTFGRGTGGGEHAVLAKRNIESCAACHDPAGADPNCILCHTDSDGIEGTNPKTHETGFMSGEQGDWHTDQGSLCYNCHLDANARPGGQFGQGFCGYCHQ